MNRHKILKTVFIYFNKNFKEERTDEKNFLKVLAVLLSAATILTAMPVSTFAFEETAQESEITTHAVQITSIAFY